MGVAGRYVLTPAIFDEIRNQPKGVGGEIQLTDAIERLMQHEAVYAFQYAGKRYDCGSKEGFCRPRWSWRCSTPMWATAFANTSRA
jgi:UTP--glucose-1-phosphate uridylyltransferase